MRKGSVAFANFICTFGDKGGLLDHEHIVLPAFFIDTLIRKHGVNRFHLYDVNLVHLTDAGDTPVIGISGHFVKNTVLSREQVFDDSSGLVSSPETLHSSPSAFFLLILNTHRLMYFAETSHAPDLKSFEATMAHFIKRMREQDIRHTFEQADGSITKTQLMKDLPRPTLKITPLAETGRVTDFIAQFASIKSVRFRLIRPNHETDAAEVVGAVRGRFAALEPDRLDILASRSDGLEKDQVAQAVSEAVETGNTEIQVKGEDHEGTRMQGTNDQFALTVDLPNPPKDDAALTKQLFGLYERFLASGKIKVGIMAGNISEKLQKLAKEV